MVNIQTIIEINKPVDLVSTYTANPDNAPEWCEKIKSTSHLTPLPIEVGSKFELVRYSLRRKVKFIYEVIEFIPNNILILQTKQGPFPMETTYSWEKVSENRTKMILTNTANPKGLGRLFAPFLTNRISKENVKDLKKLRRILEKMS